MFQISRKIDYGLLLMSSLPEQGFRSLHDLAKEKSLSVGFLSQIMMLLKDARLVIAKEGIHGGYQLAKPRGETTLAEIYEALDGPLFFTTCQQSGQQCVCEQSCGTNGIWDELHRMMQGYLKQKTLADLQVTVTPNPFQGKPLPLTGEMGTPL